MKLYNTFTRQLEDFKPLKEGEVSFYHCGPTVYWTQHIGNLRGMLMGDLVRRTLEFVGYKVTHVRNYTDVGHLVSDGDEGEDKMEKGARREGKSPEEIANKYIAIFEKDTALLNLLNPTFKPRPSLHISQIISMIKTLLEKGFAYQAELAVYFDISRFAHYTKLSGQKLAAQAVGAGKGKVEDKGKRHPHDFALWFFKKGKHTAALQTWDSPWGVGFPGWHIECSVMSKEYLGLTIDLHMGGVEHIPVHHTNEIAQSEAANGVKFVNYWLHNEHLLVDNHKMAKSEGTAFSLEEILGKGFDPMDLRYFFLQAHYRSQQNFTWKGLEAAASARNSLMSKLYALLSLPPQELELPLWEKRFMDAITNDFNIAQALAVLWELVESLEPPSAILRTALSWDRVLGLKMSEKLRVNIPQEIADLMAAREKLRAQNEYAGADKLRAQLEAKGYLIEDQNGASAVKPKKF
jgi:cysteinyl-tRNA synthetase